LGPRVSPIFNWGRLDLKAHALALLEEADNFKKGCRRAGCRLVLASA
jgi:hypothetical protein